MRLAREAHHNYRFLQKLQRAKHLLAAAGGRRSVISLTQHQHQRRRNALDISDRRAALEILLAQKWRRLEPSRLEEGEVGRVPPRFPVSDVALRDGCGKAISVSDHPIRKQSAATASGDSKLLWVNIAPLYDFIHAGRQVFEVVAWIAILNHVAEFLAVAG